MKIADGGFRPVYDIEFASDTVSQVIVGVDVATSGSDMGQMAQMVNHVIEHCGSAPENWLVDQGFPAHEQIDAVAEQTRVIAPVPKPKANDKTKGGDGGEAPRHEASPASVTDVHQRKPGDSQAVGDWRDAVVLVSPATIVRSH